MNLIVLCGMSALFTALFGTPLAATVFSLEVVSVGILQYSALFPALFASLVSLGVTRLMGVQAVEWTLAGAPALGPLPLLAVGVLAALCGLLSILFCLVMHGTARLYQRLLPAGRWSSRCRLSRAAARTTARAARASPQRWPAGSIRPLPSC